MSIKTISALVAAAAFSTGAFAQSTYQSQQSDTFRAQPTQYYQGQGQSSDGTYSGSAGTQSYSSDPSWTPQNGAYIDHPYQSSQGTSNPYARDMRDGPMGTSPGS